MMNPDTRLFVGSTAHSDAPYQEVRDPWSGELITEITVADRGRAEEAMSAAVRAFERTRAMSSHARRELLRRVARAIDHKRDDLADLIAREAGKPLPLARSEVARAIATFELAAEEAVRVGGEVMPLDVTAALAGLPRRVGARAGGARDRDLAVQLPAEPRRAQGRARARVRLLGRAEAAAAGAAHRRSRSREILPRSGRSPDDALQVVPCDERSRRGAWSKTIASRPSRSPAARRSAGT